MRSRSTLEDSVPLSITASIPGTHLGWWKRVSAGGVGQVIPLRSDEGNTSSHILPKAQARSCERQRRRDWGGRGRDRAGRKRADGDTGRGPSLQPQPVDSGSLGWTPWRGVLYTNQEYITCSINIRAYVRCSVNIHASIRCSVHVPAYI